LEFAAVAGSGQLAEIMEVQASQGLHYLKVKFEAGIKRQLARGFCVRLHCAMGRETQDACNVLLCSKESQLHEWQLAGPQAQPTVGVGLNECRAAGVPVSAFPFRRICLGSLKRCGDCSKCDIPIVVQSILASSILLYLRETYFRIVFDKELKRLSTICTF
jgi:hypothetical protein